MITGPHLALRFQNDLDQHIQGDSSFSTKARIKIYSTAWYLRLSESIGDDYVTLARSLGKNAFVTLMKEYLKKFPSSSYTLSSASDRLPEFLLSWKHKKNQPWHADLARLEYAYYKSFSAKDPEPWDLAHFAQSSPDQMENLKLTTEPSVYLIASEWEIGRVWRRRTSHPKRVKKFYMIYRRGFEAELKVLSEKSFKILDAISQTATLGEIIDHYPNQKTVQSILLWASMGVIKPVDGLFI